MHMQMPRMSPKAKGCHSASTQRRPMPVRIAAIPKTINGFQRTRVPLMAMPHPASKSCAGNGCPGDATPMAPIDGPTMAQSIAT